jgi:hypothetical protein
VNNVRTRRDLMWKKIWKWLRPALAATCVAVPAATAGAPLGVVLGASAACALIAVVK